MAGYDDQMPFGVVPSYDPMTGALIGSDPGRTEPEAMPNRIARGIIQAIANMPKAAAIDAPAALIDSARMAPLPGAERTPEGDAAMQNLAGNSFMTALGLAGGAMPFSTAGAAGIFGGRLAKTADHAMLQKAEEMHAAGADRRAILDQTGWFRGEDGKWRFEIPDDKARMNPNTYGEKMPTMSDGRIAGQIWHPELYKAYPDLRNAYGVVEGTQNKVGGSYSPPGVARSGDETINIQAPNAGAARSVGLHELQHAVQEREGFASGGNPAMFSQGDDAVLARNALSYRRELEGLDPSLTPKQKDEIVRQRYRALDAEDWIPNQAARDIAHDVEGNPAETLQRVMELYGTDKRTSPHSPRDLYRQVPGEVEARNVQTRADWTPEQRRSMPPWESIDVQSSPAVSRMFGSRVGMLEGGQASRALQSSDPMKPLTESQFYRNYSQHIDLRGRTSGTAEENMKAILENGFRKSGNVNTLPAYRGGDPRNVVDMKLAPREGDVVYLVPRSATSEMGNGQIIKEGWKPQPHEVLKIGKNYPSLYEEYLAALKRGG